MTTPAQPAPTPDTDGVFAMFLEELTNLQTQVATLTEKVTALEAERKTEKPHDDTNDRIVAFLAHHPGVKFNTGTVAANLEITVGKASNRMNSLAERGLIAKDPAGDGRLALFYTKPTRR